MRNLTIITISLSALLGVGLWYGTSSAEPKKMSAADAALIETTITSFDDCVAAGYPVMESLPEQCITGNGRSFTKISASLPVENGIAVGEPYGSSEPHSDDASAAVAAAKEAAAKSLGLSERAVGLVTITQGDWPDSCLGLGGPEEMCAMMLVPGFTITLIANDTHVAYRTDQTGTIVRPVQE